MAANNPKQLQSYSGQWNVQVGLLTGKWERANMIMACSVQEWIYSNAKCKGISCGFR